MSTRNEIHINSALQLLQARKEALDRMNRAPMRAHGKVMSSDLFTWFDYQIDDLVSTLLSFPYPIHWVAKKTEVEIAFRLSKKLTKKIETIVLYDTPKFEIPSEFADQITNCISSDTMEGALIMTRAIEQEKSVMIITGEMADWQNNRSEIEAFIKTFKK